ncbi:DUF5686 family protein [soil metagenome]
MPLSSSLIKSSFLLCGFMLMAWVTFAQETRITGKLTDVLTNEPIPFATVIFKGTIIGANTDFDGNFTLTTTEPTDSILATMVGYQQVKMRVKKGQTQVINIVLKASKIDLKEVTINAGENPANIILRNIIKHKDENDLRRLDSYQYEVYNKLEFDLTNITEKFKNRKILKPFSFIFENIDSSETNSRPFLPFFISETISDLYYRNSPQNKKEIIKGSKVSGLENASVTQFLGDMYQRTNIYLNFIDLFGKSFVSPISDLGLVYYRYYLLDSAFLEDQWCYKLKFKPRRPQELTFVGEFWVHDTTFAIKKINMRIAGDANINWVEDMAIVQEFTRVNNANWMMSKDLLVVDFAAKDDGLGFIGRKTTSYKDFKINEAIPEGIFKGSENIVVSDSALSRKDDYWQQTRHDSLSSREKIIYHMVDTIKTLPAFRTYVDIITLFFTGYRDIGKIELGPYYTLYSFNQIEGNRFRIGARTSDDLSTKILIDGYLAYGTKDQRFKYGGNIRYNFSKKPRQFIGLSFKNDVQQLGQSENAFQDDNILSSLFRRNPASKLNSVDIKRFWYEMEWVPGFSNKITLSRGLYSPLGKLDVRYYADDAHTEVKANYNVSEVSFYTRFAYREKFVTGKVDRVSIGSDYPVLQVIYAHGLKGFLDGGFTYDKLTIKVDDRIKLPPFGYTYYIVAAGHTWGNVPYPLLELHPGNETYFYDYAAFNMMNYFEFASDYYVSAFATHHFDGFFLDKIPLLRKLKWREVVQAKAVWGQLSDKNLEVNVNQEAFYTLNKKPYMEVGAGVENIFKIIRIDFLWRLAYLENRNIAKFGIRGSFQLTF